VDWLAKEKNIDPKLRIIDWQLKSRFGDLGFLHLAAAKLLGAVGLGSLADWSTVQALDRINLDGLLALWHPSSAN
jgi:protease IV